MDFFLFCYKIKNSVAVEIGIFPSPSLTNSNFHFLVTEKYARLK